MAREHPLVPTIRKALWCLLAIALSAWTLEFSFIAFAAGFGWWPGCGCCGGGDCPCDQCSSGGGPSQYQMDLAGHAAGTECDIAECASLDGAYILDCGGSGVGFCAAENCAWTGDAVTACSTHSNTPSLNIFRDCDNVFGAGDTHYWAFVVGPASSFKKDYGASKPDCNSFSSEDIPFNANRLCGAGTCCDVSSGSCALTAL